MLDELQNGYQWASQHVILCVHVGRGAKKKTIGQAQSENIQGKKNQQRREKNIVINVIYYFYCLFSFAE